jgi:hypothetical protein
MPPKAMGVPAQASFASFTGQICPCREEIGVCPQVSVVLLPVAVENIYQLFYLFLKKMSSA